MRRVVGCIHFVDIDASAIPDYHRGITISVASLVYIINMCVSNNPFHDIPQLLD